MNLVQKILTGIFFIIAIALAAYLVWSVKFKINEEKRIKKQEALVIDKLKMIRDAEIAFKASNGRYTGSFDTLIAFIDTGKIYITERTETITQLEYGAEDITVKVDTIGTVSVFDSLFVIKEDIIALSAGTIESIDVTPGSEVTMGQKIFTIKRPKGKLVTIYASNNGKIEKLAVQPGQSVDAEERIAVLVYKRTNDITRIPYLPGSKEGKKFELFAGKITKGGVSVDVFEAVDTDPVSPERKGENQEKALRVGSRTDVTTSGNWE